MTLLIISLLVVFSFAVEAQVYTASQSSTYSTCTGTYANLTDGILTTGAGCNSGSEWIKATFAAPQTVSAVTVGGGSLSCGWGATASYLNAGAVIQSSTDDVVWTDRATITGVTDAATKTFTLASCVTAQYWRISKTSWLAATEFSFTFGSNMTYTSSTTTQANVSSVTAGDVANVEIIGIQIVTAGTCSPLSATSFTFNTTGSTAPATDIQNGKLWSTGTSSTFATTTQFGSTVAAPNGAFTITGTQTLSAGTNYFWLTYNIPAGATVSNVVDAQCTALTVGSAQTPTVTAPAGSRTIIACPATYTASQSSNYGGGCGGTYANLTDGNFTTGAATNSSANEWIKATFSCPKSVTDVTVGGGTLGGGCTWGAVATYLNGAVIQSSTDDVTWTTRATISGVSDPGAFTFSVGCVTAQYWRLQKASWFATSELSFTFGAPLAYSSSTTTQNNTTTTAQSALKQQIIGVQIVVTGCSTNTLNATSFTFNTTGSTNSATDITNAKVFYSGTSSAYSTGTQFGSTFASPNGVFTIAGTQSLPTGTNYFWLAYDIASGATISDVVDAQCTALNVGGAQTPTVTAPAGSRTIAALTAPTFQCVSINNSTGTSIIITKPACLVTNDLMLAHITSRSTALIGAPAGWTQLSNMVESQFASAVFYKVATASEPADYTFTSDISDNNGAIFAYRGVDTDDPIESFAAQKTSGTSHATPDITVANDQTMIVALFGLDGCSNCTLADVVWTAPAGMTERYDIGKIASSSKGEAGNDVVQALKGCVQKTATSSVSAAGIAAIIALRPSGGTDGYTLMYLGGSTAFNGNTCPCPVTFARPAFKQNDLMVVHLAAAVTVTGSGATPPSGWTLIRFDLDGSGIGSWTYYKVAGASEPNSYTFSVSTGINLIGGIRAYRGIDPATPFQTSAGATTSGTSLVAPSITTTTDSALVVTFYSILPGASSTYTPPANTTERYDYSNVQNHWKTISGDDFMRPSAGATGTQTATSSLAGSGLAQIAAFKKLTGNATDGSCGFTTQGPAPLPIELLSFTANFIEKKKVKLNWVTASESNNDYFTIERAAPPNLTKEEEQETSGLIFQPIGKLKGAGNSSTALNYEFIDQPVTSHQSATPGSTEPPATVLYYRLKQTDYDGKFEYSEIRSVQLKNTNELKFSIYPNPASNGKINAFICSEEDRNIDLTVTDVTGRKVIVFSKFISKGCEEVKIDIHKLSSGMYFLNAAQLAEEGMSHKRFVIEN